MDYRLLGRSGLRVSGIGLGCNAFGSRCDAATASAIIDRAIDAGINLIDTADMYSGTASERIVGDALKRHQRESVVLATKGGARLGDGPNDRGSSRAHLTAAVNASLDRLQTDYIDLYQVHFADPDTPDDETMDILDDLVAAGKIRYAGASNYPAWRLCRALWASDHASTVRFQALQASYSLADRTAEAEVIPCCLDLGLGVLAYWPLGGGLLTGKYREGEPPPEGSRVRTQPIFEQSFTGPRLRLAAAITDLARQCGAEPTALALSWVRGRPGISSVLTGATAIGQLEQNLRAVDVQIEPEVAARLDELSRDSVWTPFR